MNSTIIDIAKMAGVSSATVSRVINNYPYVSEATRQKVMEAMKDLDYFPDMIARSMVKGRTYNIGLIVGTLGNPFFAETAEVIIKSAELHKCHVTLCVTEEKSWKLEEYINLLLTRRVDGIIIGSIFKSQPLSRLESSGIPYILYNRKSDSGVDYVVQDNLQGAYDAVSHLIRLGHTKIGVLHGPLVFDTVDERLIGYHKALKDYRIREHPYFVHEINFRDAQNQVFQAMEQMFKSGHPSPTAIFTTADFLALDAMEYLIANDYGIPEDVALVGFDNTRIAGHRLVGLTTVGQRAQEMAELAVERLMQKIEHQKNGTGLKEEPWRIKLKPKLMIRRTCGSSLHEPSFSSEEEMI